MIVTNPPSEHHLHPIHFDGFKIEWLKRLVPLVFLGLALHLLIPQLTGFSQTWSTVKTLSWGFGIAALAASYFGSGVLLQGLVRLGGGSLSIKRGVMITLASGGVGLVAAGIVGASASTYAWIHGGGKVIDRGDGAGFAAGLKPVFNNALILLIAVFALTHLLILGDLSRTEFIGFVAIFVILIALIGGMIRAATHPDPFRAKLTAIETRWASFRHTDVEHPRVERNVHKLENAWRLLRSGRWRQPVLGSAINVAFDAASLYLLFAATGHRIGIGALLTGYSIALLLGKAAFIPGGVGIVEATMIAIFTTLGAARADAVVVVLAYRLLSFWIPAILGLPLAGYLTRSVSGHKSAIDNTTLPTTGRTNTAR